LVVRWDAIIVDLAVETRPKRRALECGLSFIWLWLIILSLLTGPHSLRTGRYHGVYCPVMLCASDASVPHSSAPPPSPLPATFTIMKNGQTGKNFSIFSLS